MNNILRFAIYVVVLATTLGIAFVLYVDGFSGPMLLDDQVNLQTARLHSLDQYSLLHVITHNSSGMLGRGISSLSFGLTFYFHGDGTYYYKYHNFMIHCLTAIALFYLGYRLLLLTRYSKKALLIAFISVFIWLLHPLQVSTVLYIVQRMAQLSALFTVCALICYVIGRIRIEEDRRFGVTIIFVGYPIFLVLGLLSKENAALLTLFTIAIECFFFRSSPNPLRGLSSSDGLGTSITKRDRYRLLIRVCVIAVPAVVGIAGLLYKFDSFSAGYEMRQFTMYERLLTQIHILFYYLQLIVFPRLSEYSLYHDDFPFVREFGWGTLARLSAIIGILCISVISIVRKRQNLVLFGLCWFLIAHAMESTIVPLEMIFEHRNYLALYGISLAISVSLVIYLPRLIGSFGVSYSVVGAFCLLCLFVLSVRVSTWSSEEQLTLVNVLDHPKSARAHNARANVVARYGQRDKVLEHLYIAYHLQPWNSGAAIHRLSAACVYNRLTPEIVDLALSAAEGAHLTAYTWLATENLISNIESGGCKMEQADVFSLLQSYNLGIHGENRGNQAKKSFFLGRYHQYLGNSEKAIESYDRAIEGNRSAIAYSIYKVLFLIENGLFSEAENEILLLIEKDKKSYRDETLNIRSLVRVLEEAKAAVGIEGY